MRDIIYECFIIILAAALIIEGLFIKDLCDKTDYLFDEVYAIGEVIYEGAE